jgi:small nuclear ribonucleoprotein (snRNP)-like protein
MSIFRELRNECLIRELEHELNTDVLLFGFDGIVYFGNLQKIEDCRVAFLSPAIEAESNVEILSPGGEVVDVRFLQLDLWQIVAKATGVKTSPFDNGHGLTGDAAGATQRTEESERQESHTLICVLKRMIGDEVVITTLGGFVFQGTLGNVDDELAFISVDEIFGPATSSGISDDVVSTAVINLEAITSVSRSANCC